MKTNNLTLERWRSGGKYLLVIIWIAVFQSQIFLYTSFAEIIIYTLLDLIMVFIFLKFIQMKQSRHKVFWSVLIVSFILGLVPYETRFGSIALFLFESAKDETVTYYIDPYMNFRNFSINFIIPLIHFILMFVIIKIGGVQRRKQGGSG